MDELVRMVSQKLGLPEAVAKQAVEIVVGFLKDKLPAPIAAQIDGLLGGTMPKVDSESAMDKGKDFLSGLFGGDKQQSLFRDGR